MIKDILVNLSSANGRDVTSDYAISVARTLDAHLTAVSFAVEPFVAGSMFDGVSASVVATLQAECEENAKAVTSRFEKSLQGAGITAESRVIDATSAGVGDVFGRLARRYDMSIIAQPQNDDPVQQLIVEGALFGSGRPVLVVPYIQREGLSLNRVLLCWDGSRSAARAFADAEPLLERSKKIDVITIASKDDNRSEISGADIAHHLARHGLNVELKRIVAPDTDVPNTILSHAADSSTDLIVMGGYGHSRLREFVLGGATRGILASMTVPTFLSH